MTPDPRDKSNMVARGWMDQLAMWRSALVAKGATISSYEIGPPIPAEELTAISHATGRAPPASVAAVMTSASGRVDIFWQLDLRQRDPAVPESLARFGQIGELAFSPETMAWLRAEGEVTDDDRYLDPDQLALVRSSLQFHRMSHGDLLAVDSRNGAVNYLTYDSGFGEAVLLAPSFAEFMDRFTSIGCVGPEMWVLEHTLGATGIDPEAEFAKQWRAWAGVRAT